MGKTILKKYKRILLIQPPWYRLFGGGVTLKIPLGLCYISAVLNKNGFEAAVFDGEFDSKISSNLSTVGMTKSIDSYLEKNRNLNHQIWKDIENKIKSSPYISYEMGLL